eukprot:4976837-Prymnesium_polylepis.1
MIIKDRSTCTYSCMGGRDAHTVSMLRGLRLLRPALASMRHLSPVWGVSVGVSVSRCLDCVLSHTPAPPSRVTPGPDHPQTCT